MGQTVRACTYFEVPDGHGIYVAARSMEFFGIGPTNWNVATHPVGEWYRMGLFEGPWKQVEFGHVSIDFNVPKSTGLNMVADGMNIAGLTLSTNLFRDMQLAPAKSDNNSIFYGNFGRWALGSFNSTKAMIQALRNITMTDFGSLSSDLALHWAVSDKSGHSVVIEYDGKNGPGKPHILENSVRVLTTDPPYQWQVKNIDTYSFLGPEPDKNRNKQIQKDTGFDKPFDIVPANVGGGYNLRGLPGDPTSPSRFVRAFYMREYALLNAPPGNISCVLTLCQALLNSVIIPRGLEGGSFPIGFTQWAVLKAPHMGTQGTYMFRSYVDMQWRSIDLSEAKLDAGDQSLRAPVETGELMIGNALSTLWPYSVSSPPGRTSSDANGQVEDSGGEHRVEEFPCTSGVGVDRLDGYSCRVSDLEYSTQGYLTSVQILSVLAISLACCMCGTCGGYVVGRQKQKAGSKNDHNSSREIA